VQEISHRVCSSSEKAQGSLPATPVKGAFARRFSRMTGDFGSGLLGVRELDECFGLTGLIQNYLVDSLRGPQYPASLSGSGSGSSLTAGRLGAKTDTTRLVTGGEGNVVYLATRD
jgi:hypothetical protein